MDRKTIIAEIRNKRSYLLVGLDTDINKIPEHLQSNPDPVFEFNRQIIDATKDLCIGYKINTAFYEAMGVRGWQAMEKTVNYIPAGNFKIADAKRGDIGNTSTQYARAFFETFNFDAVTVAPYMGEDSIRPFLEYTDKWTIVLGLTSNKGASDFEMLKVVGTNGDTNIVEHRYKGSEYLYERVLTTACKWGTTENLMFVAGATHGSEIVNIRKIIPEHFLLVPGIGFQGGNLREVSTHGMNKDYGLLVNASRAIIYAASGEDFAQEARAIAQQYQSEMSSILK